jgi:hypothetical protein
MRRPSFEYSGSREIEDTIFNILTMPPIKQVGATFKKAEKHAKDNAVQYELSTKKGES